MKIHALLGSLALGTCFVLSQQVIAQTTFTWKNAGSDWGTAANWTPVGGPPGNSVTDLARFFPNQSNPGTSIFNPNLAAGFTFNSLTLAPNQNFSSNGWFFTGANTLTLGGAGSTGLTTYGPSEYTFNGPALAGNGVASLLVNRITNGSTLTLQGNSVANSNLGTTLLAGGMLNLDNSSTNIAARYSASSGLTFTSGILNITGGSSATTYQLGALTGSTTSGSNTIRLNPIGGVVPTVNFANSGAFSTRQSTFSSWRFETTSGNLGTDAKVTFSGNPFLGANGLLADTSGGSTVGFAVVSDANGVNFATWTAGTGIVAASPTQSPTNATALASLAANDRAQFTPTGAIVATGAVTTGSLRITPTGPGASLAMGANALSSNALMLDGPNDFSISGSGAIGGSAPRYIYVNNTATALSTSMNILNGGNPTSIVGPGVVILNGAGSQIAGSGASSLNLLGGVLRGNQTQVELTAAAANGILNFRGGVLEIQNGANGTGTAADFTRILGTAAGNVRWEGGNGGFSAYGSNASVNIGNTATPTTLQWSSTNFVQDGYALKFGSTKSNAVLNFLNPIQLDNGATYQLREINVVKGAGGDRTILAGAITGAVNADLAKTGGGTLEMPLGVTNTFSGNTNILGGTLLINGNKSGTGRIYISAGGTLGGSGTIGGSIFNSGTLSAGASPGNLTVEGNVLFLSGSIFKVELAGTTPGTQYDQLTIGSSSTYNIDPSATLLGIRLSGYTANPGDSFVIVDNPNGPNGTGTFLGLPDLSLFSFDGQQFQIAYNVGTYNITTTGIDVLTSGGSVVIAIAAVPEPITVMTMVAGAGMCAFGGYRYYRHKRKVARSRLKRKKTAN
ncbi:MAG TPA: hypothetical protein PLN21_08585 [Gemmatales bacterium]|nr:hypothetical protein [Gemmatales bacterium]